MTHSFFVPGIPKPKGSMRSFVNPKTGGVVSLNNDKGTKPWQTTMHYSASQHVTSVCEGPVCLTLTFYMRQPQKPKFPVPAVRPDIDKLARTVLDALTGVVYLDDCQVVELAIKKCYGAQVGVLVEVKA